MLVFAKRVGDRWNLVRTTAINWSSFVLLRYDLCRIHPVGPSQLDWHFTCLAVSRMRSLQTVRIVFESAWHEAVYLDRFVENIEALAMQKINIQIVVLYRRSTSVEAPLTREEFEADLYRRLTSALDEKGRKWCASTDHIVRKIEGVFQLRCVVMG